MDTGYPALIADPLTIPNAPKVTRTPDPEDNQSLQQNSAPTGSPPTPTPHK